jgi:glycosyltransferase involved in cell wall biosynthesis
MAEGKRIIYCANFYPPNYVGGAELVAHRHAIALKELGHEVAVYAGNLAPKARQYALKKGKYEGLPVERINLHLDDFGVEPLRYSRRAVEDPFMNLVREFKPDVVHFHNLQGLSLGLVNVAREAGARTVLTLHDYWGFCFKNTTLKHDGVVCEDYTKCEECLPQMRDEFGKLISINVRKDFFKEHFALIDEFISPSAYLAGLYIKAGFPAERFNVIGNGVDVGGLSRIEKKLSNHIVRFSYLGYFGKHKGIATLLDALRYIPQCDGLRINLAGEGSELENYHSQLKQSRNRKAVKFWGKRDYRQIGEVYRETDVLVVPSIWPENQPGTILEAMAAGLPVIASDIGGIPELVEDGATGFLFEPGNPEKLSERMKMFLNDPNLIGTLGTNGFNKISRFTFRNQVEKIVEVYNPR